MTAATCPRCLGTGRVWDFAHVLRTRCDCQPVQTEQPLDLPKAA